SNVAFVIDGVLSTPLHEPRTSTGNLRGITRTLISELAGRIGLRYEERPMFPADIWKAGECFVSSATREVMPVAAILAEGRRKEFPAGGGQVTKSLQSEYSRYVSAYVESRRSEAW